MTQRRTLKTFFTGRQAAVTIEFVVTIPLFLAALAFSYEFGQFFLAHQSTVNNVRSAARYLARTDLTAGDYRRANLIIRTGRVDTGGTAPAYMDNVCIDPFDCARAPVGGEIRVRVRVNYEPMLFRFIDGNGDSDNDGTQDGATFSIPFVVQENVRWVGM